MTHVTGMCIRCQCTTCGGGVHRAWRPWAALRTCTNACMHAWRLRLQEVAIMRKVRHKNVVQFIGACTRKPNLCIVFEYMSGGSVYDYIRRVSAAARCGGRHAACGAAVL